MIFDKRLLKNPRWWTCLPYVILVSAFVGPVMAFLLAVSVIGDIASRTLEFINANSGKHLYIDKMADWVGRSGK